MKKYRFDGAFELRHDSKDGVWIRSRSNENHHHTTYGEYKGTEKDRYRESRYPIQEVALDIHDTALKVFARLESRIEDHFRKSLEHELNYIVLKQKKQAK